MKQGFQVNQDGMFPGSNDVFEMKIGGIQSIEQSQIAALTLIKMADLGLGGAFMCLHKLYPTVISSFQDSKRTQRQSQTPSIHPGYHLLEMLIQCQRSGFIDE